MRYAAVIEKAGNNFGAYVPDLPGCVATGGMIAEAATEIREAIQFHIEGLKVDGLPVPPPQSRAEYVELTPCFELNAVQKCHGNPHGNPKYD